MAASELTTQQGSRLSLDKGLLRPLYLGQIAGVAIVYILAALAGLRLDAVSGFASLVWPPTGIAIAAVLLAGRRIWPAVFIGALVANLVTGAPLLVASGVATGNTLEAVIGAYALRRVPGFRLSLDSLHDVLALIVFGAALSPIVSATIGVTSLYLGGLVAPQNLAETWRTWWVGDAIGALLVAPVILVWATRPQFNLRGRRLVEAALLIVGLLVAGLVIFIAPDARGTGPLGQAYVFFPLLMWAAIRFGQRGAVTATLAVSAIAVAGTVLGAGPFIPTGLHQSLLALQTFMGVMGATFLVLGASISERERSEAQLREARDVATAANRAKAEFLAVMSHELRTPLNAIAGYAELLSLGVSGPLNQTQSEEIERIRSNQQHLLSLIDDVLTFAKIEAGSVSVAARPIRVCEELDSLEPLLHPELLRRELTFVWGGCDPSLEVLADPTKLRQIFFNVVGNSIKFTPPHGRIELTAGRFGSRVRICVSDTGIGIPSDKIGRVFEPFFQVHAGMTRQYEGVGLGLAISRDLARAMGGDVEITNVAGGGCAATIDLPVLE